MIDINLEQTEVEAGGNLAGTLIWQNPENRTPKAASVSIHWYTEGRGTRNYKAAREISLDPEQLMSAKEREIPFSLEIPEDGPISYNGSLIRVIWELEVSISLSVSAASQQRQEQKQCQFSVIPRSAR